jgi:enamine deaminase RidA (YjgF/YER057c/UK114 family)
VQRSAVNPVSWSLQFGFNQGELVEGPTRELFCAGQISSDSEGNTLHPDDMAGQLRRALDNLEAVLAGADMTFGNVVRMNIYTTDIDLFLQHGGILGERLGPAGVAPASTLLGVARLASPDLMVELEATAVS